MSNLIILIILLIIVLLFIKFNINDNSKSENFKLLYPSNMIDCGFYKTPKDCNKGYKCSWITSKSKAFNLNTPYCAGNIFDVPEMSFDDYLSK
jgi:hypothetical protein